MSEEIAKSNGHVEYSFTNGFSDEQYAHLDPIEQYRIHQTEFGGNAYYKARPESESLKNTIEAMEQARDQLLEYPTEEMLDKITKQLKGNLAKVVVASYIKVKRNQEDGIQEEE